MLTPFQSLAEQLRRARREGRAFDDVFSAACRVAVELETIHKRELRDALRSTRATWHSSYDRQPATPGDHAAKQLARVLLDDPSEHHELDVRLAA